MNRHQIKSIPQRCSSGISAFLLSMAFFSLTACGGGNSNGIRGIDSGNPPALVRPTVTSTVPADTDIGVATNIKIVVAFDRDMDAATITQSSFTVQGVGEAAIVGAVLYNSDTFTATLAPNGGLTASTVYTATITTAVNDLSDVALASNMVWSFTTGATPDSTAPTVSATVPADTATDVLRNAKVSVTFSEAIDPDTLDTSSFELKRDSNDAVVAGSFRYSNPSTVVFSPAALLDATTDYTLTLSSDIADLAGNNLTLVTVGFTTGTDVSSSPAAVDLGTSGNYVILAKTGISTTGTTHITGDIAVSPNAQTFLTGFSETLSADGSFATSALVTGKLFAADMNTQASQTPAILTTAISDMETAYTDASGRSNPDFNELGAGEIGGLTLDPGLYKWGTGVLVTSDVTLDGSSTDVWIFQIAGDLKLQDGKAVVLTGGALPENVFWQVAGEVTLQPSTTFNGIILSQTAVEAKSLAVINGRALAQTAVTLIANDVNEPAQ